jgi:hypothetical protein
MKYPLHSFTFIFCLFFLKSFAQQPQQKIDESYAQYFQDTREVPFLHLNKTTFMKGEELWFNAYVLEQNSSTLHSATTNLYCSLFDKDGTLIKKQLVHVQNGLAKGSFIIDSTYTKDVYFLKASTNWMKNFNEDNSFQQKITILNNTKEKEASTLNASKFYDFQLFPEGGHLLNDVVNSVGILVKNKNGEGQQIIKGEITNQKGEVVQKFSTNDLGMGKTLLFYQDGDTYKASISLSDGTEITKDIPIAEKTGITLQVDNLSTPYIRISLSTNNISLPQVSGKTYTVLVHNTRSFYKKSFTLQDKLNYDLYIKKGQIFKGTNIITLFNEHNQPVAERVFFNYHKELFSEVTVKKSPGIKYDSLEVSFSKKSLGDTYFLSASFLPAGSIAYNPKNNSYSKFLLAPYIKGDIENVDYYFKNTDRKKLANLDLLLLTQGWSKYNWNRIFNSPPVLKNAFENGISIRGKFNKSKDGKNKIVFYSKANQLLLMKELKGNRFAFDNLILRNDSDLQFALSTKKRMVAATPYIQYTPSNFVDKITISKQDLSAKKELVLDGLDKFIAEGEVLDEVVLKSKKRVFKNEPYGASSMMTGYKISERINVSGETIFDFLREKRYLVNENTQDITITNARKSLSSARMTSGDDTFSFGDASLSGGDNLSARNAGELNSGKLIPPIRVFLDNQDISYSLSMLQGMYLDYFDEVFFNRMGTFGSEEIHLYTKTIKTRIEERNPFTTKKVPFGFSVEKEYYTPEYVSYTSSTYQKYGAVYWKPMIQISENQQTITFKTAANLQDEVVVYIEGITKSGKVISQKKLLKIK